MGAVGGGKGGGSAPKYDPIQAEQSAKNAALLSAQLAQTNFAGPDYNVSWSGDIMPQQSKGDMALSQLRANMGNLPFGAGARFLPKLEEQLRRQRPELFQTSPSTPRTMSVSLSPFAQKQRDLQTSLLEQAGTSYGSEAAKRAEEAVYGQYSNRLEPEFNKQRENLHTQLVNQGLPIGSEAYNRVMANLDRSQTDARQQALSSSVLTGQQSQSEQLNNMLKLFGMGTPANLPSYMPGIGATAMPNTYSDWYNAAMQRYGIQAQQQGNFLGALGSLGSGLLAGGYFGGR